MNLNQNPTLRDPRYIAKDTFFYTIALTTALAAGATLPGSFNVDNDSDFFWQKGTAHAAVGSDGTTAANEQIPEVLITIKDATTGRDMMNVATPIRNLFGTGEIPYILPMEKYFGARSQVSVQFTNNSDNTTYSSIYLTFHGVKAFLR